MYKRKTLNLQENNLTLVGDVIFMSLLRLQQFFTEIYDYFTNFLLIFFKFFDRILVTVTFKDFFSC